MGREGRFRAAGKAILGVVSVPCLRARVSPLAAGGSSTGSRLGTGDSGIGSGIDSSSGDGSYKASRPRGSSNSGGGSVKVDATEPSAASIFQVQVSPWSLWTKAP